MARKRKKITLRIIISLIIIILVFVDAVFLGKYIGNKKYEKEITTIDVIHEEIPIVKTAKEQLGNHGGGPFWSWYGFNYRVPWCACFVSWCESQNKYISAGLAPKFAVTGDGINFFKKKNQWTNGKATPNPGDIIFFDWDQNGWDDHVGIVAGVYDERVYTIEGNSSDMCRIKSYKLGDKVIFGYGHINIK